MMKLRALIPGLPLCLCLLSIVAVAQNRTEATPQAGKTDKMQQEILRLEEAGRLKALKGDNVWDDLMADGAYLIAYDGTIIIYRKGQSLPSLPLKSFTLTELIVRVYGESAVVTGLAEIESETPQKQPFTFKMRFLNVWKKFGDGWKIVVSERTGVKPPPK